MTYTVTLITKVKISCQQVTLIGRWPELEFSAFPCQRTIFLMNNTYLITGGSPQHYDPTGSAPLTCSEVQLKRKTAEELWGG